MSFQDLLNEGRLEQRPTSRQEILDLLNTADRGMAHAAVEQVSLEGRFNHAYDAALIFATVSLRCAGYRVNRHAILTHRRPPILTHLRTLD